MKKTVRDIDVSGLRVLLRCDFNVPLKEGVITDDTRIRAALPTIEYLLDKGARVVLCSHLGRPKGEANPKFTLEPVAIRLSELLNREIPLIYDYERAGGEICLLENLRFHKGETDNDPEFAKGLADLADIYVSDAFGCVHRAHASTEGVTKYLPSVAGLLIEKELTIIGGAMEAPRRPFVAVLGGAKVSDKIGVIDNLITKVDALIIGGAMAYTFIAAQGGSIGKSLCEPDKFDIALEALKKAKERNIPIYLPQDSLVATEIDGEVTVANSDIIEEGYMGLDIGPEAVATFSEVLAGAGTVIWNGPLGMFEHPSFKGGTLAIAKAVASSSAISILGGGDLVAAAKTLGFADSITHLSTGGGATLEFLEGLALPGIESLENA